MAGGKAWTHEELLLAMNLYCKLPFGQLHRGNPMIVAVAAKLGRTPSSLSMKLCNLASLDPNLQARGIKGLSGASAADRAIWDEFGGDWERLGVASEERLQQLLGEEVEAALTTGKSVRLPAAKLPRNAPSGPTETVVSAKARLGQRFFRQSVLASYNSRCCITGNPVPELLVASHILPWGSHPEQRLNPRNGLCLAQTQDAAFDRGLITFDEDFRLVVGPRLKAYLPDEALERSFLVYEGKPLQMPEKFLPEGEFMRRHREEAFL
jgi:hypothetical protein